MPDTTQLNDWRAILQRLAIGIVLAAAVIVAARAAGRIGSAVPGFCLSEDLRFMRVGDPVWPALQHGLFKARDRVVGLMVDDHVRRLHHPSELVDLVAGLPVGTAVTYEVERGSERVAVTVPTARFSVLSFLAVYGCAVAPTLIALALALWAVRRQSQHPAAARFLVLTVVSYAGGLALCESAIDGRFGRLFSLSFYVLAAAFINLALDFPRRRAIVARWPWLPGANLALWTALGLWVNTHSFHNADVRAAWADMDGLLMASSMIFLGAATAYSYWVWDDREARERARVALIGYAAVPPMLGVMMLPGYLTGAVLPANLFFPLTLVMNACLAYAIVRGNVFELRHVLRRGSLTGALGVFWAVVFFTAAIVVDEFMTAGSPLGRAVQAALVVTAGLGFAATRVGLERLIDRFFFRTRAVFKPVIHELSASFTRLLRAEDVMQRTQAIVQDKLGATHLEVISLDATAPTTTLPVQPLFSALREGARPIARGTDAAATRILEACGAEVAVPIAFEGQLRAVMLLGRKRSGELYTSEDLDLLATIANQAASALENAASFEQLDRLRQNLEAEVEARTRELKDAQSQLVQAEKMASLGQLVAGVAHELNNPLAAVDGNLAVLHDYVSRLREALRAYEQTAPAATEAFAAVRRQLELDVVLGDIDHLLATCTEGSNRARRIVRDLRTFSRLDEAELKRVDLNEAIDITLNLLRHRVCGTVRVETTLAPVPPVECYASQVNQVFLNLLTNAFDAVEAGEGGLVHIATRPYRNGADAVEIEVHDTGPGIPPELRARIFDPFFTTKPVGKGTGLGLSISYSIVAKHGGQLWLDPDSSSGCTFHVVLPTRPRAEPAKAAASQPTTL
ncbi:MAG: GAF domain-containing protein [Deltaproteobacteria bacterium]|nr:GAF domain-containing protein [Deltaproteobacteria bacterium]MBI3387168.1 GAF domain-containing protein [Deltaproteobacteria bacterium]